MISIRGFLLSTVIVLSFAPLFGMSKAEDKSGDTANSRKFGMMLCASVSSGLSGLCPSVMSPPPSPVSFESPKAARALPSSPQSRTGAIFVFDEKRAATHATRQVMETLDADTKLADELNAFRIVLGQIVDDPEWAKLLKNPEGAMVSDDWTTAVEAAMAKVKEARAYVDPLVLWLADCVAKHCAYVRQNLAKVKKNSDDEKVSSDDDSDSLDSQDSRDSNAELSAIADEIAA
jgi:hypothetical protein